MISSRSSPCQRMLARLSFSANVRGRGFRAARGFAADGFALRGFLLCLALAALVIVFILERLQILDQRALLLRREPRPEGVSVVLDEVGRGVDGEQLLAVV